MNGGHVIKPIVGIFGLSSVIVLGVAIAVDRDRGGDVNEAESPRDELVLQVKESTKAPQLSVEEALALEGPGVLWLDARSCEAFETGHVPGALLLNEEEWEATLPPVFEAWRPEMRVVVYCGKASYNASQETAQRLIAETGWERVYVLEGGWAAWTERGSDESVEWHIVPGGLSPG